MLPGLFVLPVVAPGDDGTSGGGTSGRAGITVAEIDAFGCHSIEGGCVDEFAPDKTGVRKRLIVADGEQDVGTSVIPTLSEAIGADHSSD